MPTIVGGWWNRSGTGGYFPASDSAVKNAEVEFMTTARGYRYSTSIGGTLAGRRGNFIIIDDPLKADDAMSDVCHSHVNQRIPMIEYYSINSARFQPKA